MALFFAIGHISGGHFNPAVTVAGGRVSSNTAVGYIVAQCIGSLAAAGFFALIGRAPPTFAVNGYAALSMLHAGLVSVFLIETLLSAFLVFVFMGATSRRAPAGLAAMAIGLTLTAIQSTRRAAWAAPAPLLGGFLGGSIARWSQDEPGA